MMISFYLAVILINGNIERTLGNGFYKTPEECYTTTNWPRDSETREEFKCIKATGDFVNFKVIEVQK